jgi:hypothetical protein
VSNLLYGRNGSNVQDIIICSNRTQLTLRRQFNSGLIIQCPQLGAIRQHEAAVTEVEAAAEVWLWTPEILGIR